MTTNADKLKELDYLRERNLLIINFMLSKNSGDSIMLQYKQVIEDAYKNNNLKGIKNLSRDANAWAKGLPKRDLDELEIQLTNKFNESLSGDKTTHEVIRQLLLKGKIDNLEEYRVIHEYLQDISENEPWADRMPEMEKLMDVYNKK